MVLKNFDELIAKVKGEPSKKRLAIAVAADEHTLEAVVHAEKEGIITPILVGDEDKIKTILKDLKYSKKLPEIYNYIDEKEACEFAVNLVRKSKADFLMKGLIETGVILKAVVSKETGLSKGGLMSHFSIVEIPTYHKLLVAVDGGMVTYPTLEQKASIIENCVETLRAMGYNKPKVGVLTCVEKVNPKMIETVEANELKTMNKKGIISDCIVEGPISYDCAVSKEIADIKGFISEVAGDADILIAPNIHAGNILGKALTISCKARMAGFIVGAKCPIVLTSRGSSSEEKYLSIVVSAAATK